MRRWGVVITSFYAVVLVTLFLPIMFVLAGQSWPKGLGAVAGAGVIDVSTWLALLVLGQALLFVRVDRSWRKLRPRTHVAVTATAMAGAAALLLLAAVTSLLAAVSGDKGELATFADLLFSNFSITVLVSWGIWAIVFGVHYLRTPQRMAKAIQWLITGSILELLIAVPAHVIVRQRHDCSAPASTAFGIVTGTAVMLMCLGPSILALYQRRRQQYRAAGRPARVHG
jgi:hypothetical protein